MSYDPLQPDAYAEHLGDVNRSKQVVLSEDVRNANGVLIARKGQQVSPDTVQKIIQFKLVKPLEESVDIDDGLTPDKIVENLRTAFQDENSRHMHERYQLGAEVRRGLKLLERYPILKQKLTVLAMQMPHEYGKSLMTAWYGLLIARKLGLSATDRDELFLAALMHDIGMLHIDRAILAKTDQLTPEEWRVVQSHVVIGSVIVRQIDKIPQDVPRAILEHHEIADGTGYLSGRHGDDLGLPGQIVGVADAMCALLLKWQGQNRSPRDLLPVLRVNSYVYHSDVCAAFIQVLQELKYSETANVADDGIGALCASVLRDRDAYQAYATHLAELIEGLPPASLERLSVKSVFLVYKHLTRLLRSSGVLESGYTAWLDQVASNQQRKQYRDVEDTRLMLDEVRFQFTKLTRLLQAVAQDKNAMTAQEHHAFLERLNKLPSLP